MKFTKKISYILLAYLVIFGFQAWAGSYSATVKNDGFNYEIEVDYANNKFSLEPGKTSNAIKFNQSDNEKINTLKISNREGELCQFKVTTYLYNLTADVYKQGKYNGCKVEYISGLCKVTSTTCDGKKYDQPKDAKEPFIAVGPTIKELLVD